MSTLGKTCLVEVEIKQIGNGYIVDWIDKINSRADTEVFNDLESALSRAQEVFLNTEAQVQAS